MQEEPTAVAYLTALSITDLELLENQFKESKNVQNGFFLGWFFNKLGLAL